MSLTLSDVVYWAHFGLGIITSPIMLLFCVILMGYAVLKVFFANLKRGGILLIQSAVGGVERVSVPRGEGGGGMGWVRGVFGVCRSNRSPYWYQKYVSHAWSRWETS